MGHGNICFIRLEGWANSCIPLLVPKSSTEGIAVAALHMHCILYDMLSTVCSASWGALLQLQWIDLYCSLGYITTWNNIGPYCTLLTTEKHEDKQGDSGHIVYIVLHIYSRLERE